jgi:hypothetical protein
MRHHTATASRLVGLLLLSLWSGEWSMAADRYWVAKEAGRWSTPACWAATSGGLGGAGVPGAGDRAVFDAGGTGAARIDGDVPGTVGSLHVTPAYPGTITQARDLVVRGDLTLEGRAPIGWTFPRATTLTELRARQKERSSDELDPEEDREADLIPEDTPATLTVSGTLTLGAGATLLCPRSATDGLGAGRTLRVGGDLRVLGTLSADGQGLLSGPGTPKQPAAFSPTTPIAPAGAGHGGRGGYVTIEKTLWKGGGTYGSITAPISLGSGAPEVDLRRVDVPDVRGNSPVECWSGAPALGGGAITLVVGGATLLTGRITAHGRAGDTGASGGSVFLTTGTLTGAGLLAANGSQGPAYGWGRGPGGGGRVAVVLTKGTTTDRVALQAFGGTGRFSAPAAAGTVYVRLATQSPEQGTLIIDNNGRHPRALLQNATAVSDAAMGSYAFGTLLVRNAGVLVIDDNDTVTADRLGTDGNLGGVVLAFGAFTCPTLQTRVRETLLPEAVLDEKHVNPLRGFALGRMPSLREEQLARSFSLAYYPTLRQCRISGNLSKTVPAELVQTVTGATVTVTPADTDTVLASGTLEISPAKAGEVTLQLPDLPDGAYAVRLTLSTGQPVAPLTFQRKRFPWEGNTLGLTETIYPPFEPLAVQGHDVRLSQRRYRMNGFGLLDEVVSLERHLLAAPMALKLETAEGLQSWTFGERGFLVDKPHLAVYHAAAATGPLAVATRTAIEYDGCAKVQLELKPGKQPGEVKRLWLEIALNDAEVPLFHEADFEGMRRDYVGVTPRGGKISWGPFQGAWVPPKWEVQQGTEGQDPAVIWTGADTRPWRNPTVNDFVPYLWLGGPERGLAWFAANDRGWITDPTRPAQVLTREGDRVVLRLYLIDRPTTVTAPRTLIFGLQASPTRPMLKDWRVKDYQGTAPWGPMSPLGAAYCSDKYPLDRDFTLIDRWLEARKADKPDFGFFSAKADDLLAREAWPAPYTPKHWLDRWALMAPRTGMSLYFEEHWTNPIHEEHDYFKDEWFGGGQTFSRSLQDFSLYYAHELLRRGFSLYFDNTYLKTSHNTVFNDAYLTADGRVQPACTIWEQRAYYQRIWNLMNAVQAQHPEYDLKFIHHMTNALHLPHSTWATATMDNEWSWLDNATGRCPAVFPPEVLLAEMTGRQTGTQGNAFYPIGAFDYRAGADAPKKQEIPAHLVRREWAMRLVHEIRREGGSRDETLWRSLGYGQPGVRVVNYWEDGTRIRVADPRVKWLGLLRPTPPIGALVLQSYTPEAVTTAVTVPGARVLLDLDTREQLLLDATGTGTLALPEQFGTRLFIAAARAEDLPAAGQQGMLAYDDFELGWSNLWEGANRYFQLTPATENPANHVLTITPSREPGGPYPMLGAKAGALPAVSAYELSLKFRLPELPATPNTERAMIRVFYALGRLGAGEEAPALEDDDPDGDKAAPPGKRVVFGCALDVNTVDGQSYWAPSLPRGSVDNRQLGRIDIGAFFRIAANRTVGTQTGRAAVSAHLGRPDTGWHRLTLRVEGARHTLALDDQPFFDGETDATVTPCLILETAHGGHFSRLELDEIAIRRVTGEK